MRTFSILGGFCLLLFLLAACQSEPADAADDTVSEGQIDSTRAVDIAAQHRVSAEPTAFDACDLLDRDQLVELTQMAYPEDMLVESVHQQPGKSTCMFTWDRGKHSLVVQVEFNEKIEQAAYRYTKYLNHLLEDGERVDPRFPDSLYRFVPATSVVGSPAVWSEQQRSVRWHVDNIYQGFMFLTHGALTPTEPAADSILLTALAARINQRLPQEDQE